MYTGSAWPVRKTDASGKPGISEPGTGLPWPGHQSRRSGCRGRRIGAGDRVRRGQRIGAGDRARRGQTGRERPGGL